MLVMLNKYPVVSDVFCDISKKKNNNNNNHKVLGK